MKNIVKEFIFGILFLAVVIMMIGILFYEFIPTKVTPESAKYAQSQTTESLIEEIEKEQDTSKSAGFKTYELAKADVDIPKVDTTTQEYEQGKNNPFYDYTDETKKENTAPEESIEPTPEPAPTSLPEPEVKPEETQKKNNTSESEESNKKPVEISNTSNDSVKNTNNLRDTSSSAKTSK